MFLLIVMPSFVKAITFIEQLGVEKTYLTFREFVDTSAKQVVIEDVGYREVFPSKFDHVKHTYELAGGYINEVPLDKDSLVILTSGFNGLDVGFTLRLLDTLSRSAAVQKIGLIVTSPNRDYSDKDKTRFYAFSKMIGLFDIYFNVVKPGLFRYMYVDANSPPQLYALLSQLVSMKPLVDEVSLIHVKMKRFVALLAETLFLSKLLKSIGEYRDAINEYRYVLASINLLLDKAPVDLWIVARQAVDKFRASIFGYRRLNEAFKEVSKLLGDYLKTITYGKVYTEPLIEPSKLFDQVSCGKSFSSIYTEEWFKQKVSSIPTIDSTRLMDVYTQGSFDQHCGYSRLVYSSPDMLPFIEDIHEKTFMLKDRVAEIIATDVYSIPIIFESKVNRNYVPIEYYELYFERAGLSIDQYYPHSLFIGENEVYAENVRALQLINYLGVRSEASRRARSSFNTLSSLLGIRLY